MLVDGAMCLGGERPRRRVAPASTGLSAFSRTSTAAGHAENSEVFPSGSVAVAVMMPPAGTAAGNVTLKLTSPLPSVVPRAEPINVSPSP